MREGEHVPSIVIPAHDEERSIAALLTELAILTDHTEVIVACNGCQDRTVEVARRTAPWATVLDLPEPSKAGAMDAADALATTYPRLYLDADARIGAAAVQLLFAAVSSDPPGPLAAAATPRYDLSGSNLLVRSHHAFWRELPSHRRALSGTGAMVLSQAGRARFDHWPRALADDYFLDGQFGFEEKCRVPAAVTELVAARGYRDLVSRRARIHQGNLEAVATGLRSAHAGGGAGGIVTTLRANPHLLVHVPAHLAVSIGARALAWWRRRRGTSSTWYRDTSREPG
jgi:glycosyltransferase involved in cell wall biosynthesis